MFLFVWLQTTLFCGIYNADCVIFETDTCNIIININIIFVNNNFYQ